MMAFVAAAVALTLLACGAVLFGPRLLRRAGGGVSQARTNAAVLRQQLAELDAERVRGLLDEAEFARLRDELQRRLLAEAAPVACAAPGAAAPRRILRVCAAVLPVAAVGLYLQFGHPQFIGAPVAPEPVEATEGADAGADGMLMQLEAHVAASPNDARAWVMLARLRMQRDQFEPAAPKSGLGPVCASPVTTPRALMRVSQNEKTMSPGATTRMES